MANAFGAAIAEASGTVDRVYRYDPAGQESCLAEARDLACKAAVRAGADPDGLRITSVREVPLSYLPGKASRVQVKGGPPRGSNRMNPVQVYRTYNAALLAAYPDYHREVLETLVDGNRAAVRWRMLGALPSLGWNRWTCIAARRCAPSGAA